MTVLGTSGLRMSQNSGARFTPGTAHLLELARGDGEQSMSARASIPDESEALAVSASVDASKDLDDL
jgi:hypothetical protein